jgi:maltose/moltooligosaccharide transporter
VRYIDQRLVRGDPAQALLDAVGSNPANLIVVGNRGLGASEGQLLGSVPAGVVRNAVCDVLVVQTSALDEERLFAQHPGGAATDDDSRPVAEAQPEGGPPPTR